MAIYDQDKQQQPELPPLSLPRVATPPITGGKIPPNQQQLQVPTPAPTPGPNPSSPAGISQGGTPMGLPQVAQGLREMRPGEALTGDQSQVPQIQVIKGNAVVSDMPNEVRSLGDMVKMIQGMGLDRAPSWQVYHNNPDYAKMAAANRITQLNALTGYVNAHGGHLSNQDVARIQAEAKGKPTHQETLLGEMMKQKELGAAQEQAVGQFQQGLVGGAAASLDAKSGKLSFADPRYQKVFDEFSVTLRGVKDQGAIAGIMDQYQKRLGEVGDWVKYSDKKMLTSLPDDFSRFGQDLIRQLPGHPAGLDRLTPEEAIRLRTAIDNGDPKAIAWAKLVYQRKADAGVKEDIRRQTLKIEQERQAFDKPIAKGAPLFWRTGADRLTE